MVDQLFIVLLGGFSISQVLVLQQGSFHQGVIGHVTVWEVANNLEVKAVGIDVFFVVFFHFRDAVKGVGLADLVAVVNDGVEDGQGLFVF